MNEESRAREAATAARSGEEDTLRCVVTLKLDVPRVALEAFEEGTLRRVREHLHEKLGVESDNVIGALLEAVAVRRQAAAQMRTDELRREIARIEREAGITHSPRPTTRERS